MFSQACASHSVHMGGSLNDITFCLAAWFHVPSGVSVSDSMFLPKRSLSRMVSVRETPQPDTSPIQLRVASTHRTGMHSCFKNETY